MNRIYKCRDGLYLHHFDFYRLQEAGLIVHELSEVIADPHAVTVIEWSDLVSDALPADRVTISIERTSEGEDARCINVSATAGLEYMYAGEPVVKKKGSHARTKHKN